MAQKPFPLPLSLLLLDLVGALLTALGLVETSNPGVFLDSEQLFPGYNWLLIVIGGLLMLPMVLHMVKRAKQQAATARAQTQGKQSNPSEPVKVKTVERRKP